jgi:alcohol dehydrogenase, propanol-preferring
VSEIGCEVDGLRPGQKVIISTLIPCRACFYCRKGQENLCSNPVVVGATQDGAFAEYVLAPASGVYVLPDSIPVEDGCVISDAVCTAYHAVNQVACVRPGDVVAVHGASGGLGLLCVRLASSLGARVIGTGRKQWKLEKAREFGAWQVINSEETKNLEKDIRKAASGGVDVSIDATGVPAMIESAFLSTRAGGKVVVVGFSFQKIALDINRLMWLELQVMGSRTFNPVDIPRVFRLIESGIVDLKQLISHRFDLKEINQAYKMLDHGEILRGIIVP